VQTNRSENLHRLSALPPKLALFALLMSVDQASAHVSGHGTKVPGIGPNGGHLASIVLAVEADLGENAKTQAIAEWIRRDSSIEIYLWDKLRKKPLSISAPAQVKWILLGGELSQPVINVTTRVQSK